MSTTLRKCISLGPSGTIAPGAGNPQYLPYESSPGTYANLIFLADTNTRWVKIWVHLRSLWPTENNVNTTLLNQLDWQIAVAKLYGKAVILTIHHDFPLWINQGQHQEDIPLNTDLDGPWCFMFGILASRYCYTNPNRPYNGYSYVDIIEYCNEPNQIWTTNPNGNSDLAGTVALLFKRAKQIVAGFGGGTPVVGGPAVSDLGPDILAGNRNYYDFTDAVCQRLSGNGFYSVSPNTLCVWTHHNYTDVTYDQGYGTTFPNDPFPDNPRFMRSNLRSSSVRAIIARNGWRGFPNNNPGDPRIYLTEGGAQRQVVVPRWGIQDADFVAKQNYLVARNLFRLSDDVGSNGAGIDMMTNYLLITDPSYDTGMVEAPPSLATRSLYTSTWKPYPGRY